MKAKLIIHKHVKSKISIKLTRGITVAVVIFFFTLTTFALVTTPVTPCTPCSRACDSSQGGTIITIT